MLEGRENLTKGLIECLSSINEENYCEFISGQTEEVDHLFDLVKFHRRMISKDAFLSKVVMMSLLPFMYSRNSIFKINIMKIIKYFLNNEEIWQFMLQLRFDIAFIRIIFDCFASENECKHAVMIVAKAIKVCPKSIPNSIIYCLNNFTSDAAYQKSRHRQNIIGLLSLIALKKSKSLNIFNITQTLIEYCTNPLSNNVIIEATMSILLNLYEDPRKRCFLFDKGAFESMLAPFTDNYFISGLDSSENREDFVYKSCNIALVGLRVMLRSWTGILIFLGSDGCFRSLLKVLPHSSSLIQGIILNILCDMFFIDYPEFNKDFDVVLSSLESSQKQTNQFENRNLVAEMLEVLRPVRKNAIDVINLFKAVVVHTCVSLGLVQILIETILLSNEEFVKNISKIILGELLHFSYNYLPQSLQIENHFHFLLNDSSLLHKHNTIEIKNILNHVSMYQNFKNSITHESKLKNVIKYSILNEPEIFGSQSWIDGKRSEDRIASQPKDQPQLDVDINNTRIFSSTSECWSWEKIKKIFFKYPPIIIDKNVESLRYKFMLTLKNFYIPSRSNFYSIKTTSRIANLASDVAFLFFNTLLNPMQPNDAIQWVNEFMVSIANIFDTFNVSNPSAPLDSTATKSNIKFMEFQSSLQDSLSIQYFALIRFIQRSKIGRSIVENSQILIKIYNIVESSEIMGFIKAVVPNMNYHHVTCQKIIGLLITKGSQDIKKFCLDFLRAYSRLRKENTFVVNFLSQLMNDSDETVAEEASDVLDEILDNDTNICIDLISRNVPFLHLENIGVQVLSRILTVIPRKSASFQKMTKFFPKLSQEWCSNFLRFYAERVESKLLLSFKSCSLSSENNYESKKTVPKDFYLNTYKLEKFITIEEVTKMMDIIINKQSPDYDSLKMKLLFIANYASSRKGAETLERIDSNIFQRIANLSYHCEKLSVRWICIIAINIVSMHKNSDRIIKNVNWAIYNNNPKIWLQNSDYFLKYNEISQNIILNTLKEEKLQKFVPKASIVFQGSRTDERAMRGYSTVDRNSVDFDSPPVIYTPRDHHGEDYGEKTNRNTIHSPQGLQESRKNSDPPHEDNKETEDTLSVDCTRERSASVSLMDAEEYIENQNIETKPMKFMCLPVEILQCYSLPPCYKMTSVIESMNPIQERSPKKEKSFDLLGVLSKCCVACTAKLSESHKNLEMAACARYNSTTYKTYTTIRPIKDDTLKFLCESSGEETQDRVKVEKEIVCLIFNMVTQNMFNSGTKIFNELKNKYPLIFADSCYFTFVFDLCVSFNLKPRICKLITSTFTNSCWINHFFVAKNLLVQPQ